MKCWKLIRFVVENSGLKYIEYCWKFEIVGANLNLPSRIEYEFHVNFKRILDYERKYEFSNMVVTLGLTWVYDYCPTWS